MSEESPKEEIKHILEYKNYEEYIDANYICSTDIKHLQVKN